MLSEVKHIRLPLSLRKELIRDSSLRAEWQCHFTLQCFNVLVLHCARMHWLGRRRLLVLALICFFWTGLIFVGHFFSAAPFLSAPWRGEQSFEDLLRREGRKTIPPSDFVFLGLDQSTLQLPLMTDEVVTSKRSQLMM